MSRRPRRMRAFASALARDTGADVIVRYDRQQDRYRAEWTTGPDVDEMRTVAATHADEFADLDLQTLTWHRVDEPEGR